MIMKPPLNGTKTHPLSMFALGILKSLKNRPMLGYLINPGVYNRLWREDLVEEYIGDDKKRWVRITEKGIEACKS